MNVGVVRFNPTNAVESVKLVANKVNKEKILDTFVKNGAEFDSFGAINSDNVNKILKNVGEIIGKKLKPVNPQGKYNFLNAHGAVEITEEAGKEVIIFLEKVKNPIKTLITKGR